MTRTKGTKGKGKASVYQATDDDFEFDEYGQVIQDNTSRTATPLPSTNGTITGEPWSAQTATKSSSVKRIKVQQQSDIPDEIFEDDLALVNCWQSALVDFKSAHLDRFGPPTEAPRTASQKQKFAPLWYPPPQSVVKDSAPVPKSKSNNRKRKKPFTEAPSASHSPAPPKRPRSNEDSPDVVSPQFQPAPSPPPPISPVAGPSNGVVPKRPRLPSPSSFVPPSPPTPNLVQRTYPEPPPVVPVDEEDIADLELGSETGEELLQQALWSWYNAGYRTALYHASLAANQEHSTRSRAKPPDRTLLTAA